MPTKKPRISITLEEHQHAVFKAYADALNQPISAIFTVLASELCPVIERTTKLVVAAQDVQNATNEALERDIRDMAFSAHQIIDNQLSATVSSLRPSPLPSVCGGEGKGRRGGACGSGEEQYPLAINKGVRYGNTGAKAEKHNKTRPFVAVDNSRSVGGSKGVDNGNN